MANTTLASIDAIAKAATQVKPQETPEQTMARIKSELAAKGEKTGAERQLFIERAAMIPSVRAPGAGVPVEQTVRPTFTSTVTQQLEKAAKTVLDQKLGAPESFDNQLIRAQAAMYKTLLGESLTPEDLRWLSPSQQQAVRSGNEQIVKQELAATNFIRGERQKKKEEEEEKKERELERKEQLARENLALISENNLWGFLNEDTKKSLEDRLGLQNGTLDALGRQSQERNTKWEVRQTPDGGTAAFEIDAKTGQPTGITQEIFAGEPKPPTIQKFGEDDYRQWNPDLQDWIAVPGSSTTDTGETVSERYQKERSARVIRIIDDVMKEVGPTTSGLIGKTASNIPGTAAFDLARNIDAIKANIGFNELQAMREASKTGGALGQVAVQELEFLQATLGSLDIGQSTVQLRENLSDVRQSVSRWLNASATQQIPQGGSIGTTSADLFPDL